MKITDYISYTIDRFPKGYIFTYADFSTEVDQKQAVIKALNRMVAAGKIAKLSKGKYYKPETTPFGVLQPNQSQVVKDLLEENGKTIGYLTGYSIYNSLGLTTQLSNAIQIGKNVVRPAFKRGQYTISFIKQNNIITKENIPFLQILDAIRYIKKIPDTTISKSSKRLSLLLKNLSDSEKSSLVRLALKYPPSARALLGTLLDSIQADGISKPLYNSLNPITKYKLPGIKIVFPEADKWNFT
ncbi:MAG: DUF6088 family protein [Bacteroidales bacterium]|jgi:hypothetical protein|nr:DUF6088 family protein [Bacteroidales bacterium]MDD2771550.1 DUF6088 family protein [Bacteroidales bacterium]MDD3105368.1 DUF6088 family protein [Bacteroidales bacterium]MDD3550376.1 DUF6088 family protein [Bacteroidales bacterium]MDD3946021.1 DUF6088 family protein [Bacteroidales bacterium]